MSNANDTEMKDLTEASTSGGPTPAKKPKVILVNPDRPSEPVGDKKNQSQWVIRKKRS